MITTLHPSLLLVLLTCLLLLLLTGVHCRKHHLLLRNDYRRFFKVSSFGYGPGGSLEILVNEFSFQEFNPRDKFGFTLTQTLSDSLSPYLEGHEKRCYLMRNVNDVDDGTGLIAMIMDLEKEEVRVSCNDRLDGISISDTTAAASREKRAAADLNQTVIQRAPVVAPIPQTDASNRTKAAAAPPAKPVETKPVEAAHPVVAAAAAVAPKPESKPEPQLVAAKTNENPEEGKNDSEGGDQDPSDLRENRPAVHVPAAPAAPFADESNEGKVDEKGEAIAGDDDSAADPAPQASFSSCKSPFPLRLKKDKKEDGRTVFSFGFRMQMIRNQDVGLFSVYFHSCPNYEKVNIPVWELTHANLSLQITERNSESFLSAGEIPLPELYFLLSVVFSIMGGIWIQVLLHKRQETFKLHYLMALLVFVKAAALMFHGINYHFISVTGSETQTWAVLYYMMHLLKGALLLITIVLIGTGWAFVKHILSEKDKQLFMIVIPLQVLANIAEIITEESEEGAVYHNKWREIFILVDLLCCGAILFPVVWSIRHLQEAAHVDGKAATNLKKLQLFRRFYVIVVCYIYFTRIIVYLVRITLPFQYEWMDVLCQHVAIGIFFILTAYHFQPTPQNPYFRLSLDDDDLEMEEVLFEVTPNTYTENLYKKKKISRDVVMVDVDDDDVQHLISKRESSHDFD